MSSGTAMMIGLLANVAGRFGLTSSLGLRVEAGGGVLVMTGLKQGNPFTDNGKRIGAQTMPHLRVAVGLDYALSRTVIVTLTPAFSYTSPGSNFDDRIDSITRFDVLLGLAYAL
jgi:hypothetical protein